MIEKRYLLSWVLNWDISLKRNQYSNINKYLCYDKLKLHMIDIKVPTIGESISEVSLTKWTKKDGDWVERDEVIAELESEKASFEVNAEKAGKLKIVAHEGDTLKIGAVVAQIDETAQKPAIQTSPNTIVEKKETNADAVKIPEPAVVTKATPVANAVIHDKNIDPTTITPTGFQGRIVKNDVLEALHHTNKKTNQALFSRAEKREKMSNLRKTISRRLVEAKNTTAMLTTFNEVDMSAIMEIRNKFKDKFKQTHQINLGFMSFFTKACTHALQEWPAINAYIDGEEIIQHNYCDISIAVSAPKGLVVPVIRNAESLSMVEIEQKVLELATKARDNKLSMEEMTGGTFTITNGGVFGSLMSTPIINLPQSAILGMHKIEERPIAVNGQVVIKPMMYLALSYDHRIIDGRESVGFLVRVKELLENPAQLLFGKDAVKMLLEI
jgi:2-oxoglutarate dehydrogenase E2 component (dihydrolipoamide succinyltransferase)